MKFILTLISIKDRILLYFSKYKRVRRMNLNSNFSYWIKQLFTLYLHSCNLIHNTHPTNFYLLFSIYWILYLRIQWFLVSSISVLKDKLLVLTPYTCFKKDSSLPLLASVFRSWWCVVVYDLRSSWSCRAVVI